MCRLLCVGGGGVRAHVCMCCFFLSFCLVFKIILFAFCFCFVCLVDCFVVLLWTCLINTKKQHTDGQYESVVFVPVPSLVFLLFTALCAVSQMRPGALFRRLDWLKTGSDCLSSGPTLDNPFTDLRQFSSDRTQSPCVWAQAEWHLGRQTTGCNTLLRYQ